MQWKIADGDTLQYRTALEPVEDPEFEIDFNKWDYTIPDSLQQQMENNHESIENM